MEIIIFFIGLSIGLLAGVLSFQSTKKKLMRQSSLDMLDSSRHLTDKTEMLLMLSKSNELMMRFNNGKATSAELLALLDEQAKMQTTISNRARK
jgi:hypothetical protein